MTEAQRIEKKLDMVIKFFGIDDDEKNAVKKKKPQQRRQYRNYILTRKQNGTIQS